MCAQENRAVLYLRVSGRSQVDTDYDPEGLSIPAQRDICRRKAESLGLGIVGEYVELGRSATTVQGRPEYQAMIQRISTRRDVDYVIVYMLSRLNRNRTDDVLVMLQMDAVGAKLISATENIDDSPTGQMTRGILAAVNQYRSASEGQDIARKMAHKARLGGTIGPAPLGYLNVKEDIDGRQVSAVAIDEARAPLIRHGFELYATGEYSLKRLCQVMADQGLTTRQTRGRPTARLVSVNKWHQMLKNPYYIGVVTYQGEQYPGRHAALVSTELFDRVQQVLAERSAPARRDRTHFHYLKKQLYCGRCHRAGRVGKLVYTEATGTGGTYSYFFCVNRKGGTCDLDYLPVPQVEEHVVSYYGRVRLSADFVQLMAHELEAAVTHEQETVRTFHQRAQTRLKELELAEERLIDLVADGAMTAQKVRARLAKLNLERARLTSDLDKSGAELATGAERLREAMGLVADVPSAYAQASNEVRALLNDGLFKRLYVDREGVDDSQWRPPFDELVEADAAQRTQESGLGQREHRQTAAPEPQSRVVDLFRPLAGTTRASWNSSVMAGVLGRYSNDKSIAGRLARVAKALVEAQAGRSDTDPVSRRDWHPHALDSRLSATQKASLVERYLAGEGSSTLARAFGFSENGVLALLRRSGVVLRPPSKVTAADRTEMQRLRQAGWTHAAIGERFGVTRVTVSRQLTTEGD